MAEIAKNGGPTVSSVVPPQSDMITGLLAGESIAAGDACRINAADGLVYRASGAAANANARVSGFAAVAAALNDPVTLLTNGNFAYGSGLTIGAMYFLSGTVVGGLADAASTGGTKAIAYSLDGYRIRILPGGLM